MRATLPAIPGAVPTSRQRFTFSLWPAHDLGLLQIPEEHGVLRVLDGQHRLLACTRSTSSESLASRCPAVLFDSLDARQIVELFVTINAKHTRLNPLAHHEPAGRKLYPDRPGLARVRSLNEDERRRSVGEINGSHAARRVSQRRRRRDRRLPETWAVGGARGLWRSARRQALPSHT